MTPAMRSRWRSAVWSAIAPPCEKPASTSRSAEVPRSFSRAISASISFCEARTPPSSSRRIAPSLMSYHARMRIPPLIVTGCTGACGNTKRIAVFGSGRAGMMGAKSFPSAPRPCIQITLADGFFPVSISIASSSSAMRSGFLRADRRLGPEGLYDLVVRHDVGPADQVDAVRNGREDPVHFLAAVLVLQAFERFPDRLRLARQVDDERSLADDGHLPREDRGRHELEADPAHLLAEAGHDLVGDGKRRLGSHVSHRRAGTAGCEHEVAALAVDELLQRALDHRLLVRDEALRGAPGARERAREEIFERRYALVLVDAARSAVADRHEPDEQLVGCCRHGRKYKRVRRRRPRGRIPRRSPSARETALCTIAAPRPMLARRALCGQARADAGRLSPGERAPARRPRTRSRSGGRASARP